MYNIIKLNKTYIDELAQIDYESEHKRDKEFKISKLKFKKQLLERVNKKHEVFFGYKENSELKGYVTIKNSFPGYKHSEVYWLAVKKKYQGKGIGTKLMKFMERYAKRKGFRKVCIYTGKDMKLTRKFYEKLGYKFINEFPGYYGYKSGNTTAVLYCKEI